MSYMTVIKTTKPDTLGKRYEFDDTGALTKNAVANVWEGKAKALDFNVPATFARDLAIICEKDDLALMSGRLLGAATKQVINLVTEQKLAEKLDCSLKDVPGGVHAIDDEKYAARLKRGVEPSSWILIDADSPEGIPPEWAELSLQGRLELLEPIVPGISTCLRIEYRSSSARVVKEGEEPGGASHAWIQISDARKLEVLREHVRVQMQLRGLSFRSPCYSKETGEVIRHEARTVIDLAVWVPGRLVFCSRPDVRAEGYFVADADVKIVKLDGGTLNVSNIAIPSASNLSSLREKTGQDLSYSKQGSSLTSSDRSSLNWETPIEIKGVIQPLREVVADMEPGDKVRCETPFRASCSEAAFIRIAETGMPMLHDVGTSTNYYVTQHEDLGLASQASAAITTVDRSDAEETFGANANAASSTSKLPAKEVLQRSNQVARDSKGNPVFNHATAMEVMRASSEWDDVLAYNEMSEDLVLMLPVPGMKTPKTSFKSRSLSDDDFVHAVSWFNRNGFPRARKDTIVDCMEAVAKETVLSPVRHYIEDLEAKGAWDQTKRLHRLFQDYFGSVEDEGVPGADPDYLAAIGVKFMIAAVARALRPGCKVDTMLVLEGPQGAGKSSAARILAGATYFSDNLPPMNTKDASDHIRGKWIIEVGELSAMQKSEIESTKAFISRQEEKFRPAYRRKEIAYKRRCVFIGTTNQDAYLRDETGNRRFWPVAVGKIDLQALERDRDLLWAEALSRYRIGENWYLTAEEDQLAARVQRDRVSEDIWQSTLAVALEGKAEVAIAEAAALLGLSTDKQGRADQNRISAMLRALGFAQKGRFTAGNYRNSARYVRQSD